VDIAPELLDVAGRAAGDRDLLVRFVAASAENTGFADATFDIVTAGQCWWWFDPEAAVAETRRVLRPGGRIVIANFSYLAIPGNVAGRTEELVLEHNPGWPKAGWRGIHPEQTRALDFGGFRSVESFSYVVDVPFSHAGWRGRMRTCNGVGAALAPDRVERFDADLAAMLTAEFDATLSVPHRVFATTGVRP
jgi:SAM-dependent methyltransferase